MKKTLLVSTEERTITRVRVERTKMAITAAGSIIPNPNTLATSSQNHRCPPRKTASQSVSFIFRPFFHHNGRTPLSLLGDSDIGFTGSVGDCHIIHTFINLEG